MCYKCKLIWTLAALLLCYVAGKGQNDSEKLKHVDIEDFQRQYNASQKVGEAFPDVPNTQSSPLVYLYSDSAQIAYYQYKITEFKRANNVLAWQTTSSRIIFVVVLIIVITGLVFSGIQFYIAASSKVDLPSSEIEISIKGFRLHSSILGLLILAISIAFFYLYLSYVYPISILK
jgi:hypothetical protein